MYSVDLVLDPDAVVGQAEIGLLMERHGAVLTEEPACTRVHVHFDIEPSVSTLDAARVADVWMRCIVPGSLVEVHVAPAATA